jgi:hypothetical protein
VKLAEHLVHGVASGLGKATSRLLCPLLGRTQPLRSLGQEEAAKKTP